MSERGQALIEGAFTFVVFILLFIGILNAGMFLHGSQSLSSRTEAGARWGAVHLCANPLNCTDAINMTVYGNPAGTGSLLVSGLTTSVVASRLTGFDNCWKDDKGNCKSPCNSNSTVWMSAICSQPSDDTRIIVAVDQYPLEMLLFPTIHLALREYSMTYEVSR